MKIIVAGGGYAGLACLMELRRRMPDAQLHLYEPRSHHLKITHLHETVRRPLDRYRVPYPDLASRLRFEHHRTTVALEGQALLADGRPLDYDYVAVTTGASAVAHPRSTNVYDRDDLCTRNTGELLSELLADEHRPRTVTVVGGGASGVQFVFEVAERLRREAPGAGVRLVDGGDRPLASQPAGVGDYVVGALGRAGIEYRPRTQLVAAGDDAIEVESDAGRESLSSGLTLVFTGLEPAPRAFETDTFGRVEGLRAAWAAGDCARYDSRGDDAMTAQVAVRQGKHVARNIDRAARGVEPLEYFFRELGYVVSLGAGDAAGWLMLHDHVVTGVGAFAIKELVEAQYDLFVAGVDTYLI